MADEHNDELLASSTGLLLKMLGLRVTAIKIDPYMNIEFAMVPSQLIKQNAKYSYASLIIKLFLAPELCHLPNTEKFTFSMTVVKQI